MNMYNIIAENKKKKVTLYKAFLVLDASDMNEENDVLELSVNTELDIFHPSEVHAIERFINHERDQLAAKAQTNNEANLFDCLTNYIVNVVIVAFDFPKGSLVPLLDESNSYNISDRHAAFSLNEIPGKGSIDVKVIDKIEMNSKNAENWMSITKLTYKE